MVGFWWTKSCKVVTSWNSHNIFEFFYLKDLIGSLDDNNMYLGLVKAVQQVLDISPQNSHHRKKKGGGLSSQTYQSPQPKQFVFINSEELAGYFFAEHRSQLQKKFSICIQSQL